MVARSIRRGAALIDVVTQPIFACWYRIYTWGRWLFSSARFRSAAYENVVISMVSRIEKFPVLKMTLKTLFLQKARAGKVLLWVKYQDMLKIPEEIWEMEVLGLEVRVLKDDNNPEKLAQDIKKYKDCIIVTAEDDEYYPSNWLMALMKNSEQQRQHHHWSWAWH